jgi:alternate signal-mediated exported protein
MGCPARAATNLKEQHMKKMTKGAIVTGLGVALLLGGGGTLAVWNDSAVSQAGTIASGDLDLQDPKAGVWTDAAGQPVNIASYKVVPGDTLTYTQTVTPILEGDKLKAHLTVTGVEALKAHNSDYITVTEPTLTDANGKPLPDTGLTQAHSNKPVTASTTFAFSEEAGNDAAKDDHKTDEWGFSSIGYYLEQEAPTATPTPSS